MHFVGYILSAFHFKFPFGARKNNEIFFILIIKFAWVIRAFFKLSGSFVHDTQIKP